MTAYSYMRADIIHLDTVVEREPIIDIIKGTMRGSVQVFSAEPVTWDGPTIHPWDKKPVPVGHIGCTLSHISIMKAALQRAEPQMIFEDDCELLATRSEIYDFIESAPPHDILLLGATEYVESAVEGAYRKVGRFWGTHALILSEKAMRAAIEAFEAAVARGEFLPADWMYNAAIKTGLKAYGPSKLNALCQQKPGLVSAINGKIRQAPKV
jgi:GR25 family glycosyltransferase involved in LPS biosynthesis